MNRTVGAELNSFLGELLEGGKPASIPARGFSMAPFIRDGDLITIAPAFRPGSGSDQYKVGDIILFRTELDRWLVHRIIRKSYRGKRGRVVTKGDSLLQADRPVDREQVWGRVTALTRGRSSRLYDLSEPSTRWLMHAIALLSRIEAVIFSILLSLYPRLSQVQNSAWLKKAIRAPKWVLTKISFP